MIVCNGTTSVKNIVLTKMANPLATNVTSNMLANSDYKIVSYKINCYILPIALLVIILLLLITNNIKWKITNLRKFVLKIVSVTISKS